MDRNMYSRLEQGRRHFKTEHANLVMQADKRFGSRSWSHSLTKLEIDCIDFVDGKYIVGAFAIMRVELMSGIHHEELGYGYSSDLDSKPIAISNARQEAALEAFANALDSFGASAKDSKEYEGVCAGPVKDKAIEKRDDVYNRQKEVSINSLQPNTTYLSGGDSTHTAPCNVAANASSSSSGGFNPHSSCETHQWEEKLERKRKQQQMQKDYWRKMKVKELEQTSKNAQNSKLDQIILEADADESSFISTQELEDMVKSATMQHKPSAPSLRTPIFSSPAQTTGLSWPNKSSSVYNQRSNPTKLFVK